MMYCDSSSTECGLLSNENSDHVIIDINSDSFIKGVSSEDKHESDYHSDSTVEWDSNGESSEDLSLSSSNSTSPSESSDLEDNDGSSHIDSTGSDVRIEEGSSSSKNKLVQSSPKTVRRKSREGCCCHHTGILMLC